MRQLFPAFQPDIPLESVYTVPGLDFPIEGVTLSGGGRRPYVYFNMVSSVDGRAVSAAGNAEGLGSPTDRQMMYRLRAAADAVLVGAETFRRDPFVPAINPALAEERAYFFPNAPQPWGIVLSRDGKLPLDKKFFQARERRLVALGEGASLEQANKLGRVAQVVRVPNRAGEGEGKQQPDLGWLLAYLYQELGIRRLLCEGGPSLNYSFVSAGLGDELFWTLAPRLVGSKAGSTILTGPGAGFPLEEMPGLELRSLYEKHNELFFRYVIKGQGAGVGGRGLGTP